MKGKLMNKYFWCGVRIGLLKCGITCIYLSMITAPLLLFIAIVPFLIGKFFVALIAQITLIGVACVYMFFAENAIERFRQRIREEF